MSALIATAAPWYWHDDGMGRASIRTPDRGNLIVLDFGRKGMQDAQPRFAHWNGIADGAPRARMGGILESGLTLRDGRMHPDALALVASSQMLTALKAVLADLRSIETDSSLSMAVGRQVIAAITEATGAPA